MHCGVSAEQRVRAGTERGRPGAGQQEARERLVPRSAFTERQKWPLPRVLCGASHLNVGGSTRGSILELFIRNSRDLSMNSFIVVISSLFIYYVYNNPLHWINCRDLKLNWIPGEDLRAEYIVTLSMAIQLLRRNSSFKECVY